MSENESIDESKGETENLSEYLGNSQMKKIQDSSLDEYPDTLPIIPIQPKPFVPGMTIPFQIEPGIFLELLKDMSKHEQKFIGLILTKDIDQDIYDAEFSDLYDVGVLVRVLRIITVEPAGAQAIVNVEKRFKVKKRIKRETSNKDYLMAKVKYHSEVVPKSKKDTIAAYAGNLIQTIRELLVLNPIHKEELHIVLSNAEFAQPSKLCDFAIALTMAPREEMQDILQTFDLEERMDKALVLMKKELDITKIQETINKRIDSTVSKTQKEFFLREQIKAIQKELGISADEKVVDQEKFKERAKKLTFSVEGQKIFDEELEKLRILEIQSPEYAVCRAYLDWMTSVPWGISDKENDNLGEATAILEKDHYGLKEVKDMIIEFIGMSKLKKDGMKGPILLLVGPPGVGKTSIGISIARALKRKFHRLSLGGMRDEAEIKGHRRTYIGALPGKFIQALKFTGTKNPVIMLDEIDKMGASYQGDPASALLEVLDPEQNQEFLDHYLDCRFDLSETFFICTANTLDGIPSALLDRMEVIRIAGYTELEKIQIAKRYLIPKVRKESGLKLSDISFKTDAIQEISSSYSRESGLRTMERSLKTICRKVAVEIVREREKEGKKGEKKKYEITQALIKKYLGLRKYTSERFFSQDEMTGVSTGLAWTAHGGEILYIESSMNKSASGSFKISGNVGKVMEESSYIAFSYLRSQQGKILPEDVDFGTTDFHLHVPEGAIPKDGPSAGIAMATAMVSLLTGQKVPSSVAMTGEMTLTGKVLPIGGIKEKMLAAKRVGIFNIMCPKANEKDVKELPAQVTRGMNVHFVKDYKDVYKHLWGTKKRGAKKKR